jgi:hypothetical protein
MSARPAEGHNFFDRILAAMLGGAAGAVFYVAIAVFESFLRGRTEWWSFSDPLKWFILVGAVLGALGGRTFARDLWGNALDRLRLDATVIGGFIFLLLAVLAIVFFAFQLYAA